MDTFSHIVIGAGIGVLAQLDPALSNHQTISQAVILGTVIGSNAPDFDLIYRIKGKGSYIRNHRSYSHSLPALPLWSILVSGLIEPFFPGTPFVHLFLWTLIAVILHVLLDLFNVHGTQIFLPYSRNWIAFDAIPLLDPYILILHFLGFSLLPFFQGGITFLVIYVFMLLYISARTLSSELTKKNLQTYFRNAIRVKLIPSIFWFKWDVIIETNEDFLFGSYSDRSLRIEHTLSKKIDFPDLVTDSKNDQSVSDFLASTHFAYPFVHVCKTGYFIDWKDLRFRTRKFFPFRAILFISSDLKSKKGFVGRIGSLKEYKRVLRELKKSKPSI